MKLARLGPVGAEVPVLVDGDSILDLRGVVEDIGPRALSPEGLQEIRDAKNSLPSFKSAAGARVGAPISRPGAVYCIGMNYAAHAAESGAEPPRKPIMFLKPPNTVVGAYDSVEIPRRSLRTDWEVELAVVIGSRALYLDSQEDAAACIAGYALANDISEREFQLELSGGQWSKGKSSPGFTPLGPWLVTADEVDPSRLDLRSSVNGEARQASSTSDLIFSVEYIVCYLSQFAALDPGDVILTGTPDGVALSGRFPYLVAGDVVDLEIPGLGHQRQVFGQA
ncbi:MAG: fumarylacetoacetate hydrolase family protein [Microcella sp.]|uniref:fumarylacetoacetate hydrolase family protein n=1 Tax=Microcella sp. TaxID=1913979 RepID=UPI0033146542